MLKIHVSVNRNIIKVNTVADYVGQQFETPKPYWIQ